MLIKWIIREEDYMKKRGFTLAEVMIAMALIGVISSLTIPTFIANSRNKTNATRLAATVSMVESAFTAMIAGETVNDLSETAFGASQSEENLGKYIKLSGSKTALADFYGTSSPFVTLERAGSQPAVTRIFQAKNGALLIYNADAVSAATAESNDSPVPGSLGRLTIDVNGAAKPNVWGRDVFYFRIGNDGILYPAGGDNFTKLDSTGSAFNCTPGSRDQGCTARLVENGYEVDF